MLINHSVINSGATSPTHNNTKLFENCQVPKLSLASHHLSQSQTFAPTPNNASSATNSRRIDTAENQDNKSINDGEHQESGVLKLK